MRVVVIGGYGNFGARICRGLAGSPGMEVVAAGRHPEAAQRAIAHPEVQHARLDHSARDFPAALKRLAPDLVIHSAGPFQSQDYRVALAALAAGAHYLDLADGRGFVARFAQSVQSAARAAQRLAISGASSLPALSSAVIDSLLIRLPHVEEIQIAIAPGQRAPRGEATTAAMLGYAGKPFKWMNGGAWRDAWGWQELRRMRFYALGARWAAACDVPDLEIFPKRYPGVRTVEFRAALEIGTQQFALWLAALLRRRGMSLPIERWGKSLGWIASRMNVFGGELGGMLVSVTGRRPDGSRAQIEWHLTSDVEHGPEIPCMASILLARKLAQGSVTLRGAFPCMGFIALPEFEAEFARWRITTVLREKDA
ncbi:MAG TPA: saccharopine dehydrogenase NADP-binding domain-containing protein [Burkholderiales bacterium]|nr:saccharopine dehydrogenase NADP-binding domain-containing protein [Burkholderiales bacterium]